jgi:hypothetical protein
MFQNDGTGVLRNLLNRGIAMYWLRQRVYTKVYRGGRFAFIGQHVSRGRENETDVNWIAIATHQGWLDLNRDNLSGGVIFASTIEAAVLEHVS